MGTFIDYSATYGVEPICAVLPIAPSTHFRAQGTARGADDAIETAATR